MVTNMLRELLPYLKLGSPEHPTDGETDQAKGESIATSREEGR